MKHVVVMMLAAIVIGAAVGDALGADAKLEAGVHTRSLVVDGRLRTYRVYVPAGLAPDRGAALVIALHGAGMNGAMMEVFSGLNAKADEAKFVVVYPNGTGLGTFLTWNAGGRTSRTAGVADDVTFIGAVIDDVARVAPVDPGRVYATGMSNGGMMCYLLAAEMSDRIAAIAPIAGTMVFENAAPERAVPVMHFHGTADRIVPREGLGRRGDRNTGRFSRILSVRQTLEMWREIHGCVDAPVVNELPDVVDEGTRVRTEEWFVDGNEVSARVVYVEIEGGGHTWPGQAPMVGFIGRSTQDVCANAMMWEFFQAHTIDADDAQE